MHYAIHMYNNHDALFFQLFIYNDVKELMYLRVFRDQQTIENRFGVFQDLNKNNLHNS